MVIEIFHFHTFFLSILTVVFVVCNRSGINLGIPENFDVHKEVGNSYKTLDGIINY